MKSQKAGRIGVVVSDHALRGAQRVDGQMVSASVPLDGDIKKSLKALLAASPFVGRAVVLGIEGSSVLVESLVVPPGASKSARAVCMERLKGDPVFNDTQAALGVAVGAVPGNSGPNMVIHAAVIHERINQLMVACREMQLVVHTVEAAALSAWRAWSRQGLQVRLVRTDTADIVQAGIDDNLLFCRIVGRPISPVELRATISRAAQLLSTEAFAELSCSGIDPNERAQLTQALGIQISVPDEAPGDAAAIGLATEGTVLTEFTPPEERSLRAKRRLRRVRTMMAGVAGMLVASAGLLGFQRIDALESQKVILEQRIEGRQQAELQVAQLEADLIRQQTNAAVVDGARPGHYMSTLFGLIANASPVDLVLETIKIDDEEVQSSDSDSVVVPRQLTAKLHGLAGSDQAVRTFSDALLETGAFNDVRIEASERVILANGEGGERFRIVATAETR